MKRRGVNYGDNVIPITHSPGGGGGVNVICEHRVRSTAENTSRTALPLDQKSVCSHLAHLWILQIAILLYITFFFFFFHALYSDVSYAFLAISGFYFYFFCLRVKHT